MQIDSKSVNEKAAPLAAHNMVACHECDLLVKLPELEEKQKAFCPRCNSLLTAKCKDAMNRILVFSSSGLLFLALAMSFPFMSFNLQGHGVVINLLQGINFLIQGNYVFIAMLLYLFIIIFPTLFLGGIFYVYLSIKCGRIFPASRTVLRLLFSLLPWNMVEIFLIGVLVSFVKIITFADVSFMISFWAYVLFTLCLTTVVVHLDKYQVWQKLHAIKL